jgi:hypothetical protein
MRAFLALLACVVAAPAVAQPLPAAEVRRALAETAAAVATVVLDADGKARGDYRWADGRWRDYEAAWHTGQAIEALLAAWLESRDPTLLARARAAGDWWVAQEFRAGPLKGLVNAAHGDRLGALINFTTIGNGTPGLFRLSRVTGDRRYADTATRSIRWLIANTEVPGDTGLYYNIVDPATGRVWTDRSPHHPGVARPSITQVARPNIEGSPFLDACRHSGDRSLCARHLRLARHTAARQHASGFWMEFEPNDPATGTVHPRFNSWNAEALLEAHALDPDPRFLDAALRTARANARLMRSDGSFDYVQTLGGASGSASPTGSATAFAGLLWLRLRALGHREFEPQIHAAARWLIANRFPADHPDPNLRGLVTELRTKREDGRTIVLQRDLGTIFAARFLAAYLAAFR